MFTVAECVISWKAEMQDTIALSMTEAEYMAAVEALKEALWLRGLVETFSIIQDSVRVHCDSQSAIHLAKNHRYHKRTFAQGLIASTIKAPIPPTSWRRTHLHQIKSVCHLVSIIS